MTFPCICRIRKCHTRRTLKQLPEWYKQPPKCLVPGCPGLLRLDKYRQAAKTDKVKQGRDRGKVCTSSLCEMHYPHRRGCKGCGDREEFLVENAFKTKGLNDEQLDDVPF